MMRMNGGRMVKVEIIGTGITWGMDEFSFAGLENDR